MPKSLKQYLKDTDNADILTDYEAQQQEERRKKARDRAKEVYHAGKKALKKQDK